mgnify:CR=1 FL=1
MPAPFIVMCAPNGARKGKQDHDRLPITSNELADCAEAILAAGASIIHVHVRDDEGGHSLDVDRYRHAIAAIEGRVGDKLVIQVTTEACGIYSPQEQMQLVRELRPEAVSVALREICPDLAAEVDAAAFYRWMHDSNIMPQHILYSVEDVSRFEILRQSGVIPDPRPFALFVLGRYTDDLTGDVAELDALLQAACEDTIWAVCCFGKTEHAAVVAAAQNGGHARVGFENNLQLPDGGAAPDNAALVALAVDSGRESSREPASADDVRSLLG